MVARGKCERSEHAAPGSQIKSARAPEGRQTLWPVSIGLPGLSFFSRTFQGLRASRSPLATIGRACGALPTHVPASGTLLFPTRITDGQALLYGFRSAVGAVDGPGSEAPQAR
jgi:hypothetical protein